MTPEDLIEIRRVLLQKSANDEFWAKQCATDNVDGKRTKDIAAWKQNAARARELAGKIEVELAQKGSGT